MAHLLKQAQKMQSQMSRMQSELENERYQGTAGGNMVKVEMSGKNELLSIKIAREAVDPQDVEMLEDMIMAAFNNARTQAEQAVQTRMGALTSGIKIPGLR